jgi:hypothetical protein
MSKGSRKRDPQVSEEVVRENWERIFGKKNLHGNEETNKVVEQGKTTDEGLYSNKD